MSYFWNCHRMHNCSSCCVILSLAWHLQLTCWEIYCFRFEKSNTHKHTVRCEKGRKIFSRVKFCWNHSKRHWKTRAVFRLYVSFGGSCVSLTFNCLTVHYSLSLSLHPTLGVCVYFNLCSHFFSSLYWCITAYQIEYVFLTSFVLVFSFRCSFFV